MYYLRLIPSIIDGIPVTPACLQTVYKRMVSVRLGAYAENTIDEVISITVATDKRVPAVVRFHLRNGSLLKANYKIV